MKKIILFSAILLGNIAFGQFLNPAPFFEAAEEDANYLGGEYLKPVGRALGTGLNNGWFTSAKTHKLGRFDIMLHPTVVMVPEADRTFAIDPAKLEGFTLEDPNNNIAQTAFGSEKSGPAVLEYQNTLGSVTTETPGGVGFALLPLIAAQVNAGIVFNTDISLRYIPTIDVPGIDGAQAGMFGFGIKHDVLQWLPGDKLIPVDVAVQFNYSQLDFNAPFDEDNPDQEIVMQSQGYAFRALVSKKFLFFTPYAGVGYSSGMTDININGTYTFDNPDPTGPSQIVITDPVATSSESTGAIGQVGFQLKFLFIMCFSADYTFGAYNSATAGLGFSIDF